MHANSDFARDIFGVGVGRHAKAGGGPIDPRRCVHDRPVSVDAQREGERGVDRGASSIIFTGTHAGIPFEGRFSRWRADIRFDPANLTASSASVSIETASAADGIALHDQTLPGAEWFDSARHPNASFRTNAFHALGNGAYEGHGVLTIKGRAIDTELPFTLRVAGDRAVMDGNARVSRRAAGLGMESDPDAEYVSPDIGVRVHVEARRAQ